MKRGYTEEQLDQMSSEELANIILMLQDQVFSINEKLETVIEELEMAN